MKRFFFLCALVMCALHLQAAKPKTQDYADSMFRISYPANYVAEEVEQSVSFTNPKDKSELSLFFVNYYCLEITEAFGSEEVDIAMKAACAAIIRKVEKKYKTFENTEPQRITLGELPAYSFTYKAKPANGKALEGLFIATMNNGCVFMEVVQHENHKIFAQLSDAAFTLRPINEAKPVQALSDEQTKEQKQYESFLPLTETFSKEGVTFLHPKQIVITSKKEDEEMQLICNYTGGNTAVMNLHYTSNPLFSVLDKADGDEVCRESVQEMFNNMKSIYTQLENTEVQSDPNASYPNAGMDFSGKLFGITMKGHLEVLIKGKYFLVVVQQAENEKLLNMLHAVKQTVREEGE